jgi:FkbM family methyltransferase
MLKEWVNKQSPDLVYAILSSIYHIIHPNKQTRINYPVDGCWRVRTLDDDYYTFRYCLTRGSKSSRTRKFGRYTRSEFCSVADSDVVVDVGAFLGEFTIPAAEVAELVVAIEPAMTTYKCLSKNVEKYDNITPINELPAETPGSTKFNTATDPTESSVLTPDDSNYEQVEVFAKPLDDILAELDIENVNFLKMDAEGAEPEVLRGISDLSVEKLAIDTGPERNGERTTAEVIEILESRGYETAVNRETWIVFAKRNEL